MLCNLEPSVLPSVQSQLSIFFYYFIALNKVIDRAHSFCASIKQTELFFPLVFCWQLCSKFMPLVAAVHQAA